MSDNLTPDDKEFWDKSEVIDEKTLDSKEFWDKSRPLTEEEAAVFDERNVRTISLPMSLKGYEVNYMIKRDVDGIKRFWAQQDINEIESLWRGIATSTVLNVPQVVGGLMQQTGEAKGRLEKPDLPDFAQKVFDYNNKVASKLSSFFPESIRSFRIEDLVDKLGGYDAIAEQGKSLVKRNKKWLADIGYDRSENHPILYDLGSGAGSFLQSIGLYAMTRGAAAPLAFTGAQANAQAYLEARDAGATPDKSSFIAAQRAAAEVALEKVGLDWFMKGLSSNTMVKKFAIGFWSEFFQESTQAGAEEGIMQGYGVRDKELKKTFQDILYQGAIGAVVGGGGSVAIGAFVKDEAQKRGVPKDLADKLSTYAQKNAYMIDENLTEFLDKEVSPLVDSDPNSAKFMQLAKNPDLKYEDLDETDKQIYDDFMAAFNSSLKDDTAVSKVEKSFYDMAIENGVREDWAAANSKLIGKYADYAGRALGVSPIEWYQSQGLGVKVDEATGEAAISNASDGDRALNSLRKYAMNIKQKDEKRTERFNARMAEYNRVVKDEFMGDEAMANRAGINKPSYSVSKTKTGAKYPVLNYLKQKGGISPEGTFAKFLETLDVTPKRLPFAFSKKGADEVDNIPVDEFVSAFGGMISPKESNGYVDLDWLREAVRSEVSGSPIIAQEDVVNNKTEQDISLEALEADGIDILTMSNDEIRAKYLENGDVRYQGANEFDQDGGTPYSEPTIEVDGVTRSTTNSKGNPIAATKEGLENFWRWFSPPVKSRFQLTDAEISSLKRNTETLSDFLEGHTSFTESKTFVPIPPPVVGAVAGVVKNNQVFNAVVSTLPIDVVDFFSRKKSTPDVALHDSAMLEDVLSIDSEPSISLGVDEARSISLLVRMIADAGAEISGVTSGALESNRARLADANDPVFGTHARKDTRNRLNFQAVFGDSKVVDAQGKPLVVYHGTVADFDAFSENKLGTATGAPSAKLGFFFSKDPSVASSYAAAYNFYKDSKLGAFLNKVTAGYYEKGNEKLASLFGASAIGSGENVVPVYLSIKKPKIVDYSGNKYRENSYFNVISSAKESLHDGVSINNTYDGGFIDMEDTATDILVVFDPTQIKSIHNRGTFSPDDARILFQSAYHGTPHRFDKFSLEHLGSGEGAQAYGWGLYFAGKKEVAEWYRTGLSHKKFVEDFLIQLPEDASFDEVLDEANSMSKEKERFIRALADDDWLGFDYPSQAISAALKSIERYDVSEELKDAANAVKGQLYKVEIPEDDTMLLWDKPLSKQSDTVDIERLVSDLKEKYINEYVTVFDAVIDELKKPFNSIADSLSLTTGKDLYEVLASKKGLGSAEKASRYLNSLGIHGIKYLDGTSRGSGDGSYNYVIFDDSSIEIVETLYQSNKKALGQTEFFADGKKLITLFKNANPSTLPHELAHVFLRDMMRIAEVTTRPNVRADWSAIKSFLGVKGNNKLTVAQEEKFARAYEAFLFKGKTEVQEMSSVFERFKAWIGGVYKHITDLNVTLSPQIETVFQKMTGGGYAKTQQEIDKRDATLKKIYEDALNTDFGYKNRNDMLDSVGELATNIGAPLSTRLRAVSEDVMHALRRFEFNVRMSRHEDLQKVMPFLDAMRTSKMTKDDYKILDLALKNNDKATVNDILERYGIAEQFKLVREVIDSLYMRATEANLEIGFIEDYFPRYVNPKNFIDYQSYIYGIDPDTYSKIERDMKIKDPQGKMNDEQKAEFINSWLRGYGTNKINASKKSFEKARSVDYVTAETQHYYDDSLKTLVRYIEGMNERIQLVKFLGKDKDQIEESIGAYTRNLLATKQINFKQEEEIKKVMMAYFNSKGVRTTALASLRDIGIISTMGSFSSTVTQIGDLAFSMYENGFFNTLNGLGRSVVGKQILKKEDLGIEQVAAEFKDEKATSKWVDHVFKLNFMQGIDNINKETFIAATFKKLQSEASKGRLDLDGVFGDAQRSKQALSDIKEGKLTEDVKYLLFSKLLDYQPISLLEMPEAYVKGGNWRVLYMLKSYTLKQFDVYRREVIWEMKKDPVQGLKNFVALTSFLMLMGMAADEIKDFMFGRETEFSDRVLINILKIAGVSKYTFYKANREGYLNTLYDTVFLPSALWSPFDTLIRDVQSAMKDNKPKTIEEFRIWSQVPIVGKFYFFWFGGGKDD